MSCKHDPCQDFITVQRTVLLKVMLVLVSLENLLVPYFPYFPYFGFTLNTKEQWEHISSAACHWRKSPGGIRNRTTEPRVWAWHSCFFSVLGRKIDSVRFGLPYFFCQLVITLPFLIRFLICIVDTSPLNTKSNKALSWKESCDK